jgi:hypothetical protein
MDVTKGIALNQKRDKRINLSKIVDLADLDECGESTGV